MSAVAGKPSLARASLLAAGLAWTLPFLQPHHQYPVTAFYSEWLALALGLAAALVLAGRAAWREAAIPAVALAPLALIVLIGMQAAFGSVPYAEQALMAALYLLWAVLLILAGRALRQSLGRAAVADCLAWFLFAGGVLSAVIGLAQLYDAAGPLGFLVAGRDYAVVYGNLWQPNHYAAYVAMGCASAGYLYGRGRLNGALAGACLALFAFVLAVAGSRSTWLYLGAFAALAVAWRRGNDDPASRRLLSYALWLVPAFALAHWAASLPFLRPEREVLTSAQRLFELTSGVAARSQLAGEAWRMFVAAPLTGMGWGQFAWHHFLYLGETGALAAPGICYHAHNIVLHLLAETGIAGALLLAGAAWLWLADLRRAHYGLEWWWIAGLCAVLAIHSLLEYPLWYAYFLGIAALLAGLSSRRQLTLRLAGTARMVAALGIAAGALNLAAALGPYHAFERLVFDPARAAASALTDEEIAAAFTRARREPSLAPYVDLVAAHGIVVSRERLPEKLELNTRAMHFAPVNLVVFRQAMLLALAGEGAQARRELERAARAYPDWLTTAEPELAALARAHPAEFTPLLEWTAARLAQPGGSRARESDSRPR